MTELATICVVDDDPEVLKTLSDLFSAEGYRVLECVTGADLAQCVRDNDIDLILLDRKLPDGDALHLAGQIRTSRDIAIVLLSGLGTDIEKIIGLELGADDYIAKPFNVREVLARVRAVLRRTGKGQSNIKMDIGPRKGYKFAGFRLETERRRLVDETGNEISLTVGEFDLLRTLVEGEGRVLSRSQLLDASRSETQDIFDRTIDVMVLRLRRKIERNPHHPNIVVTERNVGYRINVLVERLN